MSKLTDFEQQVLNSIDLRDTGFGIDKDSFLEDLREIMPPTCTKNERKFLDILKFEGIGEDLTGEWEMILSRHNRGTWIFTDKQYPEINLKELVETNHD
jgi:hypothetical protein